MAQMYPCERLGLEIFDDAAYHSRYTIDLPIAPHHLWEVLTDVEAWPQWDRVVTKATWISPAPHRAGSTRQSYWPAV